MLITGTVIGVVGMNVMALLLVLARGWVFRTWIYRPMILNIGLSILPIIVLLATFLGAASALAQQRSSGVVLTIGIGGLAVWLLLLPNAAYLITELNLTHRREGDGVPEWYDILLVLTLAMSGVLNTMVNVFAATAVGMVLLFSDAQVLVGREGFALVTGVLVLVSFGIYLGRNLRLNSWDVLRPWRIVIKLVRHLARPANLANALGFTVVTTVFLGLMYLVVIGPLLGAIVDAIPD